MELAIQKTNIPSLPQAPPSPLRKLVTPQSGWDFSGPLPGGLVNLSREQISINPGFVTILVLVATLFGADFT